MTNINQLKIKNIVHDNVYDAHITYLNLLTNIGLIKLNNTVRLSFKFKPKIENINRRLKHHYTKTFIDEIKSGKYDVFSYLVEPFVREEREKITSIELTKETFEDDEFYFCDVCISWVKNIEKNINKHDRGARHRRAILRELGSD